MDSLTSEVIEGRVRDHVSRGARASRTSTTRGVRGEVRCEVLVRRDKDLGLWAPLFGAVLLGVGLGGFAGVMSGV
jgi:hypothetical protein